VNAPLVVAEIADGDVADVVALWERAGLTRPWNDPARDTAFVRAQPNAAVLVGRERPGGPIVAACMVGHDGHRGAVYYVAVDPGRRGGGFGRAVMAAAEDWLTARGVWKLNLMVRSDNSGVIGFYEALGYAAEERRVMAKRLDPSRTPGGGIPAAGAGGRPGERAG
jgi:ribosomal protein S18 acetylase RimI-like enzyme